jgi:anti-anti-sigma factor
MERCEVRSWDDGAVHVVQVDGEFDIAACKSFRAASERDGAELTVVDLRRTRFLDSCALGELISLQRRITARGARLGILRPEGYADRLFKLTGIETHLPLYDDRVPLLAEFNYG